MAGQHCICDAPAINGNRTHRRTLQERDGLKAIEALRRSVKRRGTRSSHDLRYQEGDREMAVAHSISGGKFVAEKPRVWLAKLGGAGLDISPDGKRLMVLPQPGPDDGG